MVKLGVWKYFSVVMVLALIAALGAEVGLTSWVEAATPIYVDAARPNDSGDGTSWATAKKTIQAGINVVDSGGTVNVAAGTYDEQVVIDKSLTLQGAGDTTIVKPSSAAKLTTVLSGHFSGGAKNIAGIIVANVAAGTNVNLKNLKVDGSTVTTKPAGADYLTGIFYRETGGVIDSVNIVGGGAWSAGDRGFGAYLSAITNTISVEVKGCTITNYDKNGIDAHGSKLTANIHHNTITGRGPLPSGDEVQNGVLIMDGAVGTVNNNTISNMAYTPLTWKSRGIMFYDNGGTANGNTITDCQCGIDFADGNATAENNIINGGTVGDRGIIWWFFVTGPYTGSFRGNTVSNINYFDTSTTSGNALAVISKTGAALTATVDGNQLTGGGATAADGIYIGADGGSVAATITNNIISGWEHGLRLRRTIASGSTIVRNNISNNTNSGIWLAEPEVTAGNVSINFNNIVGNVTYGVNNQGTGTLNAENNWWGANDGPSASPGSGDKISANVDADPWLKINISANPTSIVAGGAATSIITADMTKNSAGQDTSAQGYIPNGTVITFTTDKGSIGSLTVDKTTTNGKATATLTSSNTVETATISAKAPGDAVQAKVSTTVNFVAGSSQQTGSATGPGTISTSSSLGNVTNLTSVAENTLTTVGKPAGVAFPHGLLSFNITNIAPGSTVMVTITYPTNMPPTTQYWKCQNGNWINCTALLGDNDGDNVLTLTLTDGGLGDADGVANGTIVDPGGPVVPRPAQAAADSSAPQMPERLVSAPARITVKYLNVQPQQAQANQPITIFANIANGGDEAGSYVATLKVNGQVEETRTGRVGSRAAMPLQFTVTRDKPGMYEVDLNGQKASFSVVDDGGNKPKPARDWALIGFVICAIGVLVVAVMLILRRRTVYY